MRGPPICVTWRTQLVAEARLAADGLAPAVCAGDRATISAAVARYGPLSGARVTVVDPKGDVLADTDADASQMNNHLYRPEIQQALSGGVGSSIRRSATVSYDMLYVAVLLEQEGRVAAIVRFALPLAQIDEDLAQLWRRISGVTLATLAATLLLAVFIASAGRVRRQMDRRLRRVNRVTMYTVGLARDEWPTDSHSRQVIANERWRPWPRSAPLRPFGAYGHGVSSADVHGSGAYNPRVAPVE
jgi:hypothetical protein